MKNLYFVLIFGFFFIQSCKQNSPIPSKKQPLVIEGTTDLLMAYPDDAQFALDEIPPMYINYPKIPSEFKVVSHLEDLTLKTIDIYRDNQKVQTLNHNNTCSSLKFTDWNFDGYKDLSSLTSSGATGNRWYSIWLFNPKNQKFEKNVELDDKAGFIDTVKQFVISHYRIGLEKETWNYYRFVNSKLVFDHGKIVESYVKNNKKGTKTTLTKMVHNKLLKSISFKSDCYE